MLGSGFLFAIIGVMVMKMKKSGDESGRAEHRAGATRLPSDDKDNKKMKTSNNNTMDIDKDLEWGNDDDDDDWDGT